MVFLACITAPPQKNEQRFLQMYWEQLDNGAHNIIEKQIRQCEIIFLQFKHSLSSQGPSEMQPVILKGRDRIHRKSSTFLHSYTLGEVMFSRCHRIGRWSSHERGRVPVFKDTFTRFGSEEELRSFQTTFHSSSCIILINRMKGSLDTRLSSSFFPRELWCSGNTNGFFCAWGATPDEFWGTLAL